MKTLNKVQLIGYLGKDPVHSIAKNGARRAYLRLATDQFFKDQKGKTQRQVTWHDVVAWEKIAEATENQFIKGSHVMVEGEIQYHQYQESNGQTRTTAHVKAKRILNLDR